MVIDYIDEFGEITPLEGMRDLGIMRLASRIADLKKQGYKIKSEIVSVATRNGGRTHIARYSWADDNEKKEHPPTVSTPDTPTETDFKYFTADQVRNMSQKEVKENFTAIMKSMKKWG